MWYLNSLKIAVVELRINLLYEYWSEIELQMQQV